MSDATLLEITYHSSNVLWFVSNHSILDTGKQDTGIQANTVNTPIPHRPRIPRIDKYLDSWLNRSQFVKILTDSHSPKWVLAIRRSIGNSAQKFWIVQNFGHEFLDSKNRAWFVPNSWGILRHRYWIVIDSESFWGILSYLSSFVGNREIKPSNKTKEEIVEGFP